VHIVCYKQVSEQVANQLLDWLGQLCLLRPISFRYPARQNIFG